MILTITESQTIKQAQTKISGNQINVCVSGN